MQIIVTAKLKGRKGKRLSQSTYEYFKLLYGPSYAKLMVAEDNDSIQKKN